VPPRGTASRRRAPARGGVGAGVEFDGCRPGGLEIGEQGSSAGAYKIGDGQGALHAALGSSTGTKAVWPVAVSAARAASRRLCQ
jgi:hypothetical protein